MISRGGGGKTKETVVIIGTAEAFLEITDINNSISGAMECGGSQAMVALCFESFTSRKNLIE